MKLRWGWFLLPSLLVSGLLLAASQAVFLRVSLYRDRGFGRVDADLTLANYVAMLTDPFYLRSLALTAEVALIVVACTLLPYDQGFELGATLAEASGSVALNHPHCARFCVLGGASCSRTANPG